MPFYNTLIFRLLVPSYFRRKIRSQQLRKNILTYYAQLPGSYDSEVAEVLEYLKSYPVAFIPYPFAKNYVAEQVEVFEDAGNGLKYVLLEGKRLYFKRNWSEKMIRNSFNELQKEQDPHSAHCYLSPQFGVNAGDVIFDIGTAEGNFALGVVEKASRLVLFETDTEWIEALQATFEPWKDKVLIVNKFISDTTDDKNTRLDDFVSPDEHISFLKIDVDGAEARLLKGCERILSGKKPLKVALCTYHKHHDEADFTRLLLQNGFHVTHSDGYLLCYFDRKLQPPYLRRGLLRAQR